MAESNTITGDDIRAARDKLGESQTAFGNRLGVSQPTIHRWETSGVAVRGIARVAIERLFKDLELEATA